MTYQHHETLSDGTVLMAATEDGRSIGYVFRDGRWFGEGYEPITDHAKIVQLGQLFASGRARQSVDRFLDS